MAPVRVYQVTTLLSIFVLAALLFAHTAQMNDMRAEIDLLKDVVDDRNREVAACTMRLQGTADERDHAIGLVMDTQNRALEMATRLNMVTAERDEILAERNAMETLLVQLLPPLPPRDPLTAAPLPYLAPQSIPQSRYDQFVRDAIACLDDNACQVEFDTLVLLPSSVLVRIAWCHDRWAFPVSACLGVTEGSTP